MGVTKEPLHFPSTAGANQLTQKAGSEKESCPQSTSYKARICCTLHYMAELKSIHSDLASELLVYEFKPEDVIKIEYLEVAKHQNVPK